MNADAISDLILAVVAFSIAFVQLRQRPALAIGCGLIGLAAAIGTLHYQYGELFAGPHRFTGLVAASAGFPLLVIALRWPDDSVAQRITAAGRFALLVGSFGVVISVSGFDTRRMLVPLGSVLLICATALVTRRVMPLGAALVFIVSLAAGATGEEMLGPLSGIQWLHYLLSLALLLLHRDRVVPLLAASR